MCVRRAAGGRRASVEHAWEADVLPATRAEVPLEAAQVLGLDIEASLCDHRRGELRDGRLQVEPAQPGHPRAEVREHEHQRKVCPYPIDDVRVAHLDGERLAARIRRAVHLRDRARGERLLVERREGGQHRLAHRRLHLASRVGPTVPRCLRVELGEDGAQPLGEDVRPRRRPLPPLDEGSARTRERHLYEREPDALPEGAPVPRHEGGEHGGQEDEQKHDGAREQLPRPRRLAVHQARLLLLA